MSPSSLHNFESTSGKSDVVLKSLSSIRPNNDQEPRQSTLQVGLQTIVFAPWVSYYSLLGVVLALRLPPTGMSTPSKAYAEALFKGISS
ncbi:hypothetical protein K435DRAFT_867285 [Dendrothele bispora CBS 962.96]|uniref:Uncharacterized protein n=1 Tax=Dendrothele bispora (strain CBS 962.96) TaxID=1314807 RepID=A0A4S8LEP6_DENBC|nr:hypothetical protein K435DRAFT_867285 [Dendrothele bispora CBS 962.96]